MSNREKLIEIGLEDFAVFENPDYDVAIDFIEYNTMGACPNMGEKAPIIFKRLT